MKSAIITGHGCTTICPSEGWHDLFACTKHLSIFARLQLWAGGCKAVPSKECEGLSQQSGKVC